MQGRSGNPQPAERSQEPEVWRACVGVGPSHTFLPPWAQSLYSAVCYDPHSEQTGGGRKGGWGARDTHRRGRSPGGRRTLYPQKEARRLLKMSHRWAPEGGSGARLEALC